MSASALPLPVWRTQTSAILRTELRKNFVTKRGFWIYFLALAPVFVACLHSILTIENPVRHQHILANDTRALAGIFQMFYLRPAVFFGCVGIFTYLFRGEVLERSLHYYFLSPVKRELILASKYAAGLITSCFFFCGGIALTFAGIYAHFPPQERSQFLQSAGYGHLASYVAITALACMAYGALFVWMGIRYKKPILPAVFLIFWESVNIFLPAWMRKISILYYLRSMTPVDPELYGPGALFGGVAEPVSIWVAVLCLFAITAGLLGLATRELKHAEISYSTD